MYLDDISDIHETHTNDIYEFVWYTVYLTSVRSLHLLGL